MSTANRYRYQEEDEDNNFRFGNRNQANSSNSNNGDDELKRIQEQIGHVENESLASTQRALRALNEAEEVGVKTAEELVNQGEKLQRIEESMDNVDQKLSATQKNLNQLKGFFGGMMAKFSRNKDGSKSSQNLKSMSGESKDASLRPSNSSGGFQEAQPVKREDFAVISGSDREAELNQNLAAMSSGLGRLKNLGLEMSRELERQDPLIDRLNEKTERTHVRIENQNTQMKKLLK